MSITLYITTNFRFVTILDNRYKSQSIMNNISYHKFTKTDYFPKLAFRIQRKTVKKREERSLQSITFDLHSIQAIKYIRRLTRKHYGNILYHKQ